MKPKNGQVFESFSNAKTHLRYHVVFATKYRRKALAGIENSVYRAFDDAAAMSDFKILEIGVDLGDHVHMLVTFKPSLSIEQVVRRLKMLSTKNLWDAEPVALRRHFWGARKRLWSGGYFVSTVGYVDTDAVTACIRNQAQ